MRWGGGIHPGRERATTEAKEAAAAAAMATGKEGVADLDGERERERSPVCDLRHAAAAEERRVLDFSPCEETGLTGRDRGTVEPADAAGWHPSRSRICR